LPAAPGQPGAIFRNAEAAVRAARYRLRSKARPLHEDLNRSLACCGLGAVPQQAGGDGLGRVVLRHGERRATLAGVTRCANPWACPVCGPKLAVKRAEALRPQILALAADGYTAFLATLTVRHTREASLASLFGIIGKAWTGTIGGDAWMVVGAEFARGWDFTWTEAHGHHLHLHVMLLLPPVHGDGEAMAAEFLRRWMEQVGAAGGEALPSAQHIERVGNLEGALQYAVTPAACYEAVGMAKKQARQAEDGHEHGKTPFEILAMAVDGDRQARAVWREYVAATKRQKQVNVSRKSANKRGLKLKGDAKLAAEGDAEETRQEDADAVAALTPRALRAADRLNLLPAVLDAAEAKAGDPQAVRAAVAELLALLPEGDWWILPLSGAPPDRCCAKEKPS
jgi:hypothetical protein